MRVQDSSAGRSALFLTGLSALSQVLGFFYRVGLSRLVGAEVMGLYQLVMPVYSVLMSVSAVGLTAAVSNLSARYLAVGNSRAVEQTLRRSPAMFACVLLPAGALVVMLYDPISVHLLGDARTQLGLVLLLPCVALTGVENVHKHFFYGTGQVRPPALVELTEQFIRTGAVLGLLVLFLPQNPERTVGLIVTGMIICEVFSSVTLTLLYRGRIRRIGLRGEGEHPRRLSRRMAAIALPVGLTALLGNLMNAANAAIIPQRLVAAGMERGEAMSAFGVLCGMTLPMLSLPMLFLGALNLVMVPRVAHSCALGRMDAARRGILRALEVVSVIILPAMALMTVVGPKLGVLLFDQPLAGRYMMPLAFAMVCSAFQSVLSGALNAMEQQGTCAGIALICDVVQLAVTVLAMGRPGVGMDGFVAGLVIASVLGLVLCLLAVERHIRLRGRLWKLVGLPGLGAVLSWQTGGLLFNLLEHSLVSDWLCIGLTVAFGLTIYVGALCAMGLDGRVFFREKKKCVDKSGAGHYNN
ncbi:MAG: oligosaccharide flippase family protein [Oscillospiraceae bacterium]|nr:oligosaccharide flippase family protein [Oscillospiraceae bacterium]